MKYHNFKHRLSNQLIEPSDLAWRQHAAATSGPCGQDMAWIFPYATGPFVSHVWHTFFNSKNTPSKAGRHSFDVLHFVWLISASGLSVRTGMAGPFSGLP